MLDAPSSVFKLVNGQVVKEFDWLWQPDHLQEPKHYIFNALNPVNGLEYGHMGIIAYNKSLVLDTHESGLDFTLSQAHEVVPILSGIAHFNQSPWMTWRTAFREVVKLYVANQVTRIDSWLASDITTPFGRQAQAGAHAGYEYAKENSI